MLKHYIGVIFKALFLLTITSFCLFYLIRLAPGGPLAAAERNPNVSTEKLSVLRNQYGLDRPLLLQYVNWVCQCLRGDFGNSYKFNRPVSSLIAERLPNTILLIGIALFTTILASVFIGIYSAINSNSFFDQFLTIITSIGQAIPLYWLGSILILVFYVILKNPISGGPIFPCSGMNSTGQENNLINRSWHLVLPILTLTINWIAWYSRYLKANMRVALNSEYVIMARSKGLPEWLVVYRHVFPNVMISLVTIIAIDIPTLFGGSLLAEVVFAWPGMGRLFWDAARARDYPILLAVVLINSILVIISNSLADIVYQYLDPRIRLGEK